MSGCEFGYKSSNIRWSNVTEICKPVQVLYLSKAIRCTHPIPLKWDESADLVCIPLNQPVNSTDEFAMWAGVS